MNLAEKLDALAERRRFGMVPGLERIQGLLDAIGNPERAIAAVHVAGTNGKGSTAAMIASVLSKAGFGDVGLYTSPHLVAFNERIRINGRPVDDAVLEQSLDRVLAASDEATFFECATAVAFDVFMTQGVRIAVVEVGLGGRLDATNVVTPVLSVITSIGLEHCQYLGDTLGKIATEKAGIVKRGRPVVISASITGEARESILDKAHAVSAPVVDCEVSTRRTRNGKVSFDDGKRSISGISLPLAGEYQMQNLATAVTALETFEDATGLSIGDDAFKDGLEAVEWPGRFQILREDPLVIVDGAHNPPAALALRDSIKSLRTGKPIAIVAGFCDDKDSVAVLKTLRPVFKKAFPTAIPSPRSLTVEECTERFKVAGYADVAPFADWRDALGKATEWARENDGAVVVCGSLFLVGAILSQGPLFPNESLKRG